MVRPAGGEITLAMVPSRRKIVIGSMALQAAIGQLSMWQIYIGIGMTSMSNALLQTAYAASVPLLADRERLTRVNGLIQTGQGLALVGGPALAGILVSVMGIPGVLAVDALTFVVGAICVSLARIPRPQRDDTQKTDLLHEAHEGWRKRKHELAQLVAGEESDPRVVAALK